MILGFGGCEVRKVNRDLRIFKVASLVTLVALMLFAGQPSLANVASLTEGLRQGTDCDCSKTGAYEDPKKGKAIKEAELNSLTEGTSPGGTYQVSSSGTDTVNLTITRAGTGDQVLSISFLATGAGWGFSPDDHRFVFHFTQGGSQHVVKLYDLTQATAGNPLGAQIPI